MGRKESPIEDYITARGKANGALVRKVTYQGRKGAPDRWLFFPYGKVLIIEAKAPGETPEPQQIEEMRALRRQGFYVCWVDSKQLVDEALWLFSRGDWNRFEGEFPL